MLPTPLVGSCERRREYEEIISKCLKDELQKKSSMHWCSSESRGPWPQETCEDSRSAIDG